MAVDAYLEGISVAGNAPVAVAQGFGIAALFTMTVIIWLDYRYSLDASGETGETGD